MNAQPPSKLSSIEWMTDRRRNHFGRVVVWLHRRYCPPRLVPYLWGVVVALAFLQLLFITFG
jgi:hypothetical protein